MRNPAKSIMDTRKPSVAGATVATESPSKPSKLTAEQATDVLKTAFIACWLTLNSAAPSHWRPNWK